MLRIYSVLRNFLRAPWLKCNVAKMSHCKIDHMVATTSRYLNAVEIKPARARPNAGGSLSSDDISAPAGTISRRDFDEMRPNHLRARRRPAHRMCYGNSSARLRRKRAWSIFRLLPNWRGHALHAIGINSSARLFGEEATAGSLSLGRIVGRLYGNVSYRKLIRAPRRDCDRKIRSRPFAPAERNKAAL